MASQNFNALQKKLHSLPSESPRASPETPLQAARLCDLDTERGGETSCAEESDKRRPFFACACRRRKRRRRRRSEEQRRERGNFFSSRFFFFSQFCSVFFFLLSPELAEAALVHALGEHAPLSRDRATEPAHQRSPRGVLPTQKNFDLSFVVTVVEKLKTSKNFSLLLCCSLKTFP